MHDISQSALKNYLTYDPFTGLFTWLVRSVTHRRIRGWNTRFAGKTAGHICKHSGYVMICIDGVAYSAHRLAYLYMMGKHPFLFMDHKNTIRHDNRWSNLRLADHQGNSANSVCKVISASGLVGVRLPRKQNHGWQAAIEIAGKYRHLGTYPTSEEASAVYNAAAQTHYGEFFRKNRQ